MNEKLIEDLLTNSLKIDCTEIYLAQSIDVDPIEYRGIGTIYQKTDGNFYLKMYIKKDTSHPSLPHTYSRVIPDEEYFTLKAVDIAGKEWQAENLLLEITAVFNKVFIIESKIIDEIITVGIKKNLFSKEKYHLLIIIPGKHTVPYNQIEKVTNTDWALNKTIFSSNNIIFEFKKTEKYLTIDARSEKVNFDKNMEVKIIEALSIITGVIMWPVVIENTQGGTAIVKLKSIDNTMSNKKIPCPFKHSSPIERNDFICFFEKYLEKIGKSNSDVFSFWFTINRAFVLCSPSYGLY